MAKRFVDTDLWQKEWFQLLSLKEKLLVKFLFENCDNAGVWETNYRFASFIIGESFSFEDIENINNKKELFILFDKNKIYIKKFIEFQYGKLSYNCKPHLPIIKKLQEYGLDFEVLDENNLSIKQKRKRLTEAAKKEIFIRDKFECQYCGSKEDLEIDHIIPLSKGGDNEEDNLITVCHSCNTKKTDLDFREFYKRNKSLFKNLDRVSKIFQTLEEKEKEKEKEQVKEKEKEIPLENFDFVSKPIEPFCNSQIDDCIEIYKTTCVDLCKLTGFERRDLKTRTKISEFLSAINCDMDYYKRLCVEANQLKYIANSLIDISSMVNNHIGIMNGKYVKKTTEYEIQNKIVSDYEKLLEL